MKINNQFNWENSKTVEFFVSGISEIEGVSNALKVSDMSGEVEYLKVNLAMNENFKTMLNIPDNVELIKVTYGTITKTYNPQTGSVKFDYIIEVAE